MNTRYTSVFLLALLCSWFASAQESYLSRISIENPSVSKAQGVTTVAMDFNLKELNMCTNDILVISPVILADDQANSAELSQVAVIGKRRSMILDRRYRWNGLTPLGVTDDHRVIRDNGSAQTIHYVVTIPYAEWQRAASLVLRAAVIGCADCTQAEQDRTVIDRILPEKFVPQYRYEYITPEVEPIKQRSEKYSAFLNYQVGSSILLRNFKDNDRVLAGVDKIITDLKSDQNLTISDFTITGYASPEGSTADNLRLSQMRAEAFAGYIAQKYGYGHDKVKVKWYGEDWKGLEKALRASDIPQKERVLEIIASEVNLDARDALIRNIDGGRTYARLLDDFYSGLRRNDYDIAFVSRPFKVDEAKEIIRKKPTLLSLNEMFLVANTYEQDSPEYKEVFDIACRTFPESQVARINAAVGELRADAPEVALEHLRHCSDSPMVFMLKAIAYAKSGNDEKADLFFNKAKESGDAKVLYNVEQWQKYKEDIR